MPTLLKRITDANVSTQITGTSVQFSSATFYGVSGAHPNGRLLPNVSNVYIGIKSGELPTLISSGESYNWNITPKAQKDDLSNFWVNGAVNDGVYVIYHL